MCVVVKYIYIYIKSQIGYTGYVWNYTYETDNIGCQSLGGQGIRKNVCCVCFLYLLD